jgi:hypothetical protein
MVPCKTLYTSTNRVFKINNSRFSRCFQQLCNKRSDVTNSGCWTQFCAHDSWRKLNVNIFQKNTLRKGNKHNFIVVFMVPKTFTKLSVHNQAELILYGGLKKEQYFGVQCNGLFKGLSQIYEKFI